MDLHIRTFILDSNIKALYIIGNSGTGKSTFVDKVLRESNFEYLNTCLHEIKSDEDLEKMILSRNVVNMFYNKKSNTIKVIVIDDIDTLGTSDKKIISLLTSLLKNKKIDSTTRLIFIGSNDSDKKVKDLMKFCMVVHVNNNIYNPLDNVKHYDNMMNINENICCILNGEYVKDNVYLSDKSSLCMVLHENIVDHIHKPEMELGDQIKIYSNMINNIAQGDVYDRISFQKQLWKLSDMSYIVKLDKTYELYKKGKLYAKIDPKSVRFTKILTKYSNEFSNLNFVNDICNTYNIKKYEIFEFVEEDKHKNILKDIEIKRIEKIMS
jgi:hypothetical protein